MNEKKLLGLVGGIIAIAVLCHLSTDFFLWFFGLVRAVLSGNSPGKVYFLVAWFALTPLIAFWLQKFKEKIPFKTKTLTKAIFALTAIGLILGVFQFHFFASEFDSNLGGFATMVKEPNYTNWELSNLQHNHLPKSAIYFLEKTTGIFIGNEFDDGKPMYSIQQNPALWGIAFSLIVLGIFASTLLLLIKIFENESVFGFALNSFIGLAAIIRILDGGLFTSETYFLILAFGIIYARYFAQESKFKNLLPLLFTSFWFFADVLFLQGIKNPYPNALVLCIGLAYYFIAELNEKKLLNFLDSAKYGNPFTKLTMPVLNLFLAITFLLSLFAAVPIIEDLGFGRTLIEPEFLPSFREKGVGIYIYGLNAETSKEELKDALEGFGHVIEIEKEGWNAYARIQPNSAYKAKKVELGLKEKLKPRGYFYLEENAPIKSQNSFEIKWLEPVNEEKCISGQFLDCNVLGRSYNEEKNQTTLRIECKTYLSWQMLSLLTNIRENNCNQKLVLFQV